MSGWKCCCCCIMMLISSYSCSCCAFSGRLASSSAGWSWYGGGGCSTYSNRLPGNPGDPERADIQLPLNTKLHTLKLTQNFRNQHQTLTVESEKLDLLTSSAIREKQGHPLPQFKDIISCDMIKCLENNWMCDQTCRAWTFQGPSGGASDSSQGVCTLSLGGVASGNPTAGVGAAQSSG